MSETPQNPHADEAAASYNPAIQSLIAGDVGLAEQQLSAILAADPGDADALGLLARAAGMRNNSDRELQLIVAAVEIRPEDGPLLALLARCLARRQAPIEADYALRRALASGWLSDVALDDLSNACRLLGRHRDAANLLTRAANEGSTNAAIFFNLGNSLKFLGEFEEARVAYRRAAELAPEFHKVHAALAALGGDGNDSTDLAEIEKLIAHCRDPDAMIHLRHAAAKRCDALGNYDAAWDHLTAGKSELASSLGADPFIAIPAMDELCERLERQGDWVAPAADPTGPVFILGMPRSGTTVLDRLISNHDQVTSIGESMYFAQLVKTSCGSESAQLLDSHVIDAISDHAALAEAGRLYEQRGLLAVEKGCRFLDKFHLNFMLAPHLIRALPHARLLCMVRDPLDTIVGNYRQLFEFRSDIYRYTLDIEATAAFYIKFRRIVEIMQRLAPRNFMIVEYERLVVDPESEARRIFDFCGLPWQPGCSRIELNSAPVATASAAQVRSGIDQKYVGRGRRYTRHLSSAIQILRGAGFQVE